MIFRSTLLILSRLFLLRAVFHILIIINIIFKEENERRVNYSNYRHYIENQVFLPLSLLASRNYYPCLFNIYNKNSL